MIDRRETVKNPDYLTRGTAGLAVGGFEGGVGRWHPALAMGLNALATAILLPILWGLFA